MSRLAVLLKRLYHPEQTKLLHFQAFAQSEGKQDTVCQSVFVRDSVRRMSRDVAASRCKTTSKHSATRHSNAGRMSRCIVVRVSKRLCFSYWFNWRNEKWYWAFQGILGLTKSSWSSLLLKCKLQQMMICCFNFCPPLPFKCIIGPKCDSREVLFQAFSTYFSPDVSLIPVMCSIWLRCVVLRRIRPVCDSMHHRYVHTYINCTVGLAGRRCFLVFWWGLCWAAVLNYSHEVLVFALSFYFVTKY